ncbi:MAG: hypothetical protein AAGF11_44715, partial [Myxococcota bacterium]
MHDDPAITHHEQSLAREHRISDTEAGRVLLLGPTFDIEQIVPVDVPWIQDAVFAGERLLV